MSRLGIETAASGLALRKMATFRLLATAYSFARRMQLAIEGVGSASTILALTGMAAGLAASLLSGAAVDRGLGLELP